MSEPSDDPKTRKPEPEEFDDAAEGPAGSRFLRFTRRLLDRKELTDDAKLLIGAVLDTSDRAKTEMVRMAAREVRNYLDELKVVEGLRELATSHSLEVKASFSLKPLADKAKGDAPDEG